MRDALLARDFEEPVPYWRFHRLAVDAYCLQHGPYVKSANTIAHVHGIDQPVRYGQAVEEWARSAWNAYRELQPLSRKWIEMSARLR
jgi:hypothetical protein